MASKPTQIYDLVSCDVGSYPTITNLTSGAFRHSMEGQIVYLPDEGQANEYKSYNLTYQGNNTAIFEDWLPTMALPNPRRRKPTRTRNKRF